MSTAVLGSVDCLQPPFGVWHDLFFKKNISSSEAPEWFKAATAQLQKSLHQLIREHCPILSGNLKYNQKVEGDERPRIIISDIDASKIENLPVVESEIVSPEKSKSWLNENVSDESIINGELKNWPINLASQEGVSLQCVFHNAKNPKPVLYGAKVFLLQRKEDEFVVLLSTAAHHQIFDASTSIAFLINWAEMTRTGKLLVPPVWNFSLTSFDKSRYNDPEKSDEERTNS